MRAYAIDRDVVRAHGADAASYLHGQLSQDIEALAPGDSARSFLLDPTGKTVAWLRVTRRTDDSFVLDADPGCGEAMVARLERFKLRTACTFERLDWSCVVLRGDDVPPASELRDAAELVIASDWVGGAAAAGADLLGSSITVPPDAVEATQGEYDDLRVISGVPVTGIDLAVDGIPNEGGPWVVGRSVSFTKGCYTGQELVMRIDSRGGNVPHPLRRLDWSAAPGVVLPAGAEVIDEAGKVVGRLTTVGAGRALATVGRTVAPDAEVAVRWDGGQVAATVHALPGAG